VLNPAPFAKVSQTIEEAVERASLPASFSALLRIPLQQPGKVLAGAVRPTWPVMVLTTCAATGGDPAIGSKVAAAVELFIASLDVLDEVEDGDYSPTVEAAGQGQALNVSTALLLLAQQILLQLTDDGVPADHVALLARTLVEAGVQATGGQHRDLASENDPTISTDEALTIARLKAGALAGGACRLGALVGTSDATLLDLYQEWGQHYGTAAQLSNDLHDAENQEQKSDTTRHKGTLPLLYSRTDTAPTPATMPPAELAASGALHFTWVILEIERQHCLKILAELTEREQAITGLRELLGVTE
jgi:geranylgeranyl pyrophosphate synthase